MAKPEISICMITYNKAPFVRKSVRAIMEAVADPNIVEFLVLNNGCTDYTEDVLVGLSRDFNITICGSGRNLGLNGYSVLADRARGEMIVTADDDVFYLSPGWERVFGDALNSREIIGYIGADTINEDGGRMYDATFAMKDLPPHGIIELGPVGGWFAATTRQVMDVVGGFHRGKAEMFLEDLDYQRRCWANGYACGVTRAVRVLHARAPIYYRELGCEDAYREKIRLAGEAGLELEPLV